VSLLVFILGVPPIYGVFVVSDLAVFVRLKQRPSFYIHFAVKKNYITNFLLLSDGTSIFFLLYIRMIKMKSVLLTIIFVWKHQKNTKVPSAKGYFYIFLVFWSKNDGKKCIFDQNGCCEWSIRLWIYNYGPNVSNKPISSRLL